MKIFFSFNKKIYLLVPILFLLSVAVFYYPYNHKGYFLPNSARGILLAKNLYFANLYSIDNAQGVVLSPSLIKSEGVPAAVDNKLSVIIYSKIFRVFGFSHELPIKISIIFYSLSGLMMFFLIRRLFGVKIALIFYCLFIFTPIVCFYPTMVGQYEFAFFFFSLALLFYFWNFNKNNFINYLFLLLSSIFFALAFLSRNAYLFSFFPFIVYELLKNRSTKRIFLLLFPFLIISGSFLSSDLFIKHSPSTYFGNYIGQNPEIRGWEGHAFPDPYTYYFERDKYVNEIRQSARGDVASSLVDLGYSTNFKEQILLYLNSLKFYIKNFSSLIYFGGPLIIIFMAVGLYYLWRKNKELLLLFSIWFIIWFSALIYLQTSNFNHFLEVVFPLILFMSLGINFILANLKKLLVFKPKTNNSIIIILFFFIVWHLITADKWLFHERFETAKLDNLNLFIKTINSYGLSDQDIIATNIPLSLIFNYYTDKNFIYFDSLTLKNLLEENKLREAFDKFKVNYIFINDKELKDEIINSIKVKSIF